MKLRHLNAAATAVLAGLLLAAAPGTATAASLAGSKGDVRFNPTLPGGAKDECTKAFKAYVAAGGHSAYATTAFVRVMDGYIICGAHLNAQSQKAAEQLALKSCQATRSHYKVAAMGVCEIAASK